jgi:hypothetical protein
MDSSKIYKSINGRDWSYINDLPNKNVERIFYKGSDYILLGYRNSSNTPNEGPAYAMTTKSGELWNYSAVSSDIEFVNDIINYKNLTILATSKGLFTLTIK